MVADEWRDEVGEARAQVEELKDVRCFLRFSDVWNSDRSILCRRRRKSGFRGYRDEEQLSTGCGKMATTMLEEKLMLGPREQGARSQRTPRDSYRPRGRTSHSQRPSR